VEIPELIVNKPEIFTIFKLLVPETVNEEDVVELDKEVICDCNEINDVFMS
jgi:hypothetical protein